MNNFRIFLDGDSCSKLSCTEKLAKHLGIECHIFCNGHSANDSEYSIIHIVDSGKDAADFAIISKCRRGDIVITNDSGLAAMVLAKNAFALSYKGFEYTSKNIDILLASRHIRQYESRKRHISNVNGMKQPKYKHEDYLHTLRHIISKAQKLQNREEDNR